MFDRYSRKINYLRWAVTDRCNLRCAYCMPEENMHFVPRNQLLTFEEMASLLPIFEQIGLTKIRFTGGEPLVRKGIMEFFSSMKNFNFNWHITTNGVLLGNHFEDLVNYGLKGVNLSLDTLDQKKFQRITRRNDFHKVMQNLRLVQSSGLQLKVNAVIQKGINDDEIFQLMELAVDNDIEVRFIEFMPFNGKGNHPGFISANEIKSKIQLRYPLSQLKSSFGDTAETFIISGFKGQIGIIPAYTRSFCGSCNRLRLDAQGAFRTCLYGSTKSGLKKLIRSGASTCEIRDFIENIVAGKEKNGYEAEEKQIGKTLESMSAIGG